MRELSTEECIHIYEYGQLKSKSFVPEAVNAAYVAGLAALYEKLEREKNDPLTLEELLEMDGEPVWNDTTKQWVIVDTQNSKTVNVFGRWRPLSDSYYRRKPEGRTR